LQDCYINTIPVLRGVLRIIKGICSNVIFNAKTLNTPVHFKLSMRKLLLFGTVFLALVLVASPVVWAMTKDEGLIKVAKPTKQGESEVEGIIHTEMVSMSLRSAKHEIDGGDSFFDIFTELKMSDGDNLGLLLRGVNKERRLSKAEWKDWLTKVKSAGVYESGGWMKIMKSLMADGESGNWMKIMKTRMADGKGTDNVVEEIELVVEEIKLRRAADNFERKRPGRVKYSDITLERGLHKTGERVALVGFGSFSIAKRNAETETNPEEDTEIKIPAKKVVRFKAGSDLSKTVA